jgi:hypothetical protein
MLNEDSPASQSSNEVDLCVVEQVVIATGKSGMRLLLDLEDNVARDNTGSLVALATELDLGAALDTAIDVNMENLAVDYSLLAHALLASVLVLDGLAFAVAVWADGLESLDHGTHLAHHGLHAVTVAPGASFYGTLLAAAAFALGADDRTLEGELGDLAAIDILEGYVVSVEDGLRLLRTTLLAHAAEHAAQTAAEAAAAEELSEEVLCGHTTAASTTFQAGFAILIVNRALLGIREYLICMRDLLELFLSSGVVRVLVWNVVSEVEASEDKGRVKHTRMVLESILLVRLLQLLIRRGGRDL